MVVPGRVLDGEGDGNIGDVGDLVSPIGPARGRGRGPAVGSTSLARTTSPDSTASSRGIPISITSPMADGTSLAHLGVTDPSRRTE